MESLGEKISNDKEKTLVSSIGLLLNIHCAAGGKNELSAFSTNSRNLADELSAVLKEQTPGNRRWLFFVQLCDFGPEKHCVNKLIYRIIVRN